MDPSMSAFAIYKQQHIKKRKNSGESKNQQRKEKKHKGISNGHKPVKAKSKPVKKPKLSSSNKKEPVRIKAPPKVLTSSDNDVPTLVPIVNQRDSAEHTKKTETSKKSITNGNTSKSIKQKTEKKTKQKTSLVVDEHVSSPVFNPVTQGLAIFKWIIDPIGIADFFEQYWEKEVLYIKRQDPSYFKDVFSSSKLDNILREFPLHFTRNVDVVVYENGKKEVLNPDGRAVPTQLWDYYSNGCSIRLLNPQTYDQNVHSIISSLQEYFGTMVGTNVYLTPPNSQGFAPHFDDIEAFIIQLEGSKHWKLYKPKGADVLARDSSKNFTREELDVPFLDVTLDAGDVLYFPRGTIHEGSTREGIHSLHITISVYQHTAYADLLEHILPKALKEAASKDIEYRKGLPVNYLKHVGLVNKQGDPKKKEIIVKKVKSLVQTLVNYIDVDSAADKLGRKFMHDAMPPLYSKEEAQLSSKYDGDFMNNGIVFNRIEIALDTKIRLLRYYCLRLVKEDETYKLYYCTDNAKSYHGEEEQWLELDESLISAVEILQKKYPHFISVQDLPTKDESETLQLVSDLWERGLLVTDAPLPSISSDVESEGSSLDSDQVFELVDE